MKKQLALIFLFVAISFSGYTQQLPHYTQYMLNYYGLNPAAITNKSCFDAKLGYREQWVGLAGHPITQFFSLNGFIPPSKGFKRGRHGVGTYIENDETGVNKRTSFFLSYSYHKPVARELTLAVGFFGGVMQHGFDANSSYYVERNDPAINGVTSAFLYPDICPGIWFYTKDYFGGASIKSVVGNKLDKIYGTKSRLTRHLYVTYGYRILSMNKSSSFTPSFLFKFSPFGAPSLDLNLLWDYRNKFGLGVTYRTIDAVAAMIRVNLGRIFMLGYSYDYTLSKVKVASSNSHEVIIGVRFCKVKDGPADIDICPAYR